MDASTFKIDYNTGEITTSRQVGKPLGETYNFSVIVATSGYSADEAVSIAVTKYNRFAPEFLMQTSELGYVLPLHSSITNGDYVYKFYTRDNDAEEVNRMTEYSISGGRYNYLFSLDEISGVLTLKTEPPPQTSFKMYVSAHDLGSPHRDTQVTITITPSSLSGMYT